MSKSYATGLPTRTPQKNRHTLVTHRLHCTIHSTRDDRSKNHDVQTLRGAGRYKKRHYYHNTRSRTAGLGLKRTSCGACVGKDDPRKSARRCQIDAIICRSREILRETNESSRTIAFFLVVSLKLENEIVQEATDTSAN